MLADLKKYPHLRHYTDLKAAADAALYELTGAISDRQREMSDLRANFVDIAPLAVRDAAVLQRYAEARTKADTIGHMLDDLKPAVRAAERAVESAAKELGRAIDGADRHVAAMAREAEDARPDGRPVVYAQAMSAYLKRTGGTDTIYDWGTVADSAHRVGPKPYDPSTFRTWVDENAQHFVWRLTHDGLMTHFDGHKFRELQLRKQREANRPPNPLDRPISFREPDPYSNVKF